MDEITLDLTDEERDKLGRSLVDKIHSSLNAASDLHDDIRRWRDQYDAETSPKNFPWPNSANLNVPVTRSMLDTIHARALRVMRGVAPFFRITARKAADVETAKQVEDFVEWQCQTDIELGEKMDEIVHISLRDGVCIVKVPWVRESRIERDRHIMSDELRAKYGDDPTLAKLPNGKWFVVQEEVTERNGPQLDVIDALNWVMYPHDAPSIQKAQFVGHRVWKTEDDLRRGVRDGIYNEDWVDALLESGADKPDPANEELGGDPDRLDTIGLNTWSDMDEEDRPFQLFEIVAKYDADGDGIQEDCLLTIEMSRGIIIRAIQYPYWHGRRCFVAYTPYPRPGHFYGYSVPKILSDIALEINAIRNQRVDAGTLTLAPMLVARRGARTDPNKTRWRPGGVLWMDNTEDIKPLYMQANTQAAFAEEGAAREVGERVTGVSDYAQGQSPSRSRTLGEVQAVLQEGNLKFDVVISRLQASNNEVATQVIGLNRQFLPDDQEYTVREGEESLFKTITKNELRCQIRIRAHGNTMNSNRELDMQMAEKLYMMSEKNPLFQKTTRLYSVTRNFLEKMGILAFEPYIGTLEEAQQMEEAASQAPPPLPPPNISGRMDEVMTLATMLESNPDFAEQLQKAAQLATILKINATNHINEELGNPSMPPAPQGNPLPAEADPANDNDELEAQMASVGGG